MATIVAKSSAKFVDGILGTLFNGSVAASTQLP